MLIHRLLSFQPIVYMWGGIAFDDYTLSKILILPSDADVEEITFHDEEGSDYIVPANHIFIVGKWSLGVTNAAAPTYFAGVGPSAAADGAPTKLLLSRAVGGNENIGVHEDVFAVFVADEYVTGLTNTVNLKQKAGTALYGVEIDIS